jgi:chitinase
MHLKQRHPHLQVILSVGGGASADTFPVVASSTILRDNFGRSVRGLVEASGLDGIDSKTLPSFSPVSSLAILRDFKSYGAWPVGCFSSANQRG